MWRVEGAASPNSAQAEQENVLSSEQPPAHLRGADPIGRGQQLPRGPRRHADRERRRRVGGGAAAGEGAGCQWRHPGLLIGQPGEIEVTRCPAWEAVRGGPAVWAWAAPSTEDRPVLGSVPIAERRSDWAHWGGEWDAHCEGLIAALAARKTGALPRPSHNLAAAQRRQGGPAARHEQAGRASPPCRPPSPRSLPQLVKRCAHHLAPTAAEALARLCGRGCGPTCSALLPGPERGDVRHGATLCCPRGQVQRSDAFPSAAAAPARLPRLAFLPAPITKHHHSRLVWQVEQVQGGPPTQRARQQAGSMVLADEQGMVLGPTAGADSRGRVSQDEDGLFLVSPFFH